MMKKWNKVSKPPKEQKEKFPRNKNTKLKLLIKEIEALDMTKIIEEKKVDFWNHLLNRIYYSTRLKVDINIKELCETGYDNFQIRQLIVEALHQEFFFKPVNHEKVWATIIAVISAIGTVLASIIAIILAIKS